MDASTAPQPPPDAGPSVSNGIDRKLSPGVVLLIAILAMVFFIIGLINLLVQNLLRLRRARARRHRVGDAAAAAGGDGSPTAFQGQLQQLFHLHDAGVDQAFIDALPVFPYRDVAGRREGEKDPFDCAVCLCEFAADDKLRLLPTCGHAFHVPCIDSWLLSHSTCPLCRGSILADAEYEPGSSPALLWLESGNIRETVARDGGDPGDRDSGEAPKDAEEIVEVKLGKLRCVDGNVSARDLAVDGTGSSNGRGSLGQRRCLSMGSYEYVMDEHAALRVAIKATPKRRPASSRSRRRHALSASDFGSSKKGVWETAVTVAAAGCRGDGAASLNKDSFSTSKIWMVPTAKREDAGGRAAESAGERRAASFRWPAMAAGCKKHCGAGAGAEASWDVEAAGGRGDSGAPAPAGEQPSLARAAMLWVAGGRQGSHS
ncbi:putative RING-H2 finger protein ATL49 [Dichanthelium oligosanthes]|uniref:RING-type E3 ubiquitin transferase n=1 Tax=Dichanthelium oligosanthes TaxID=888268 RepID=A0A1E5VGX3_9POAL|nr:putative RING-H2 finger protein ATL49 [Dichanthelium oligosanthes]